jgi:hypothetical protein
LITTQVKTSDFGVKGGRSGGKSDDESPNFSSVVTAYAMPPSRTPRSKEYDARVKWTTQQLDIHLDWLENRDLVGKKSRVEVAQAAYEEIVLKQDTDVAAAKVGSKIDASKVPFIEALGFEIKRGLDGTTPRDKQLEKCTHFNRCDEA